MDAARWERIDDIFHRATELTVDARDAFIDAESCGDANLAAQLRRMLEADRASGTIVDQPLGVIADQLMMDLLPIGVSFGPYQVERLLGEGGMGIVYLAERADLHSRAAVKVLRDAWLSPARRERFATEQRMLAQFNHPGIARLYDVGTLVDGTPWIAMEYVSGVSLTEYCRQRACSLRERLRLFRDVCDAVGHAHRHLIVHRDLKPSNIMVTPDGGVKLLDFGIAKQLEPEMLSDQSHGVRPMTPGYAAPEQLRGEPVGVHTDVYTLGVILYQLLTSRLPFDLSETTPESAATLILTRTPERPSSVARSTAARSGTVVARADEWADLDVLCLNAMHPDAQRRYTTVDAFIRDVDHFVAGQPLDARPDGVQYRVGKFVRRHRAALAAATAVIVLFIGLASFYTIRLARARDAAIASADRADRVQQFTMDLFNGGQEEQVPADSLRVVTLLDRGVEQAQQLGNEPVAQAGVLLTLGKAFTKLGKYDRADSLLRRSLERRRAVLGPDDPDVAASLLAFAELREAQGKLPEAEQFARDALAMLQRVRPPEHTDIPVAMSVLARMLVTRGQFAPAIVLLNDVVRLQSTSGSKRDLGMSLQVLATAHFYAGHLAEADSFQRAGLAVDRTVYGDGNPQIASDIADIGNVQFQRGNYVVAESAYRKAVAVYEGWFGKDHPETAMAQFLLAQSLVKLSRPDEAQALLDHALAVDTTVHRGPHAREALIFNAMGVNAQLRGHPAEAERYLQRTADIYRTLNGPNDYMVGMTLTNIAATWIDRHDYPQAERLLRESLAILTKTLPPDHPSTALAHARLGRTLVRQSRWKEAEPELLAGYEIGNKKSITSDWVNNARDDLAATYAALGREDEAQKYRKPPSATR